MGKATDQEFRNMVAAEIQSGGISGKGVRLAVEHGTGRLSTKAIIEKMHDEMHAKIKAAKDARAAGNMDGAMAKLDACDALAERIVKARSELTAGAEVSGSAAELARRVLHAMDHSEDDALMHVELIEMCEGVLEAEGGSAKTQPPVLRAGTDLPDSDITVICLLNDDEYPVWPCFLGDGAWRSADGEEIKTEVVGWMHLNDLSDAMRGMLNRHAEAPETEPQQAALVEIVNSVLEARDALGWAERLLHDMPEAKAQISGILSALKKNVAEVENA